MRLLFSLVCIVVGHDVRAANPLSGAWWEVVCRRCGVSWWRRLGK